MFKSAQEHLSVRKWYAKAVILKQEDPDLFRAIADLMRGASQAHGLDEESGVASFLRECERGGSTPLEVLGGGAGEVDDEELQLTLRRMRELEPTFWKSVKGGFGWAVIVVVALGVIAGATGHDIVTSDSRAWIIFGPAWLLGIPLSYYRQKRRLAHYAKHIRSTGRH